jgi:hypothetical protein
MQLALQRTERLDYVFAEVRSFSIFFKELIVFFEDADSQLPHVALQGSYL